MILPKMPPWKFISLQEKKILTKFKLDVASDMKSAKLDFYIF